MEDVAQLQTQAGHEVAFFAMQHPQNEPSTYAAYFPPHREFTSPNLSFRDKLLAAGRMLYSTSAARGVDAVIERFQPDIVHLHNIYHQLSPSVLRPLARLGLPAVMTLHDYKLACPTYQFLDHGRLCEACLGGRFHNAVLRRCKDDSLPASSLAALETFIHTVTRAYAPVRLFICPSRFMAQKMAQAGVFPDRLRHLNHFIDARSIAVKEVIGGPLLFAGRLSAEKGVDTLIHAVARLPGGAAVDIVGDGPLRSALEMQASQDAPGRVRFRGHLPKRAVYDLMRAATAVVMPSRWYENQPITVLEAYACGVPVVGTALGGLPELIEDGVTGALVPAGDARALAAALGAMLASPGRALAMGQAARQYALRNLSPANHLERLGALYAEAAGKRALATA